MMRLDTVNLLAWMATGLGIIATILTIALAANAWG
jgi:hypothetical protein